MALFSAWLSLNRLAPLGRTYFIIFFTSGFTAAWLLAGSQAANQLKLQVQPECHQKPITGLFQLEDLSLRPKDDLLLTFSVLSHSPCLIRQQRLQAWVTPNERSNITLRAGNIYELTGTLKAPYAPLQLQGFDVQNHWFKQSIGGHIKLTQPLMHQPTHTDSENFPLVNLRHQTNDWLKNTLNNHPQQAVVIALVTGDTGLIDTNTRELFNQTGIAHLIAISGFHITMLAYAVHLIVGYLWRQSRFCLDQCAPQTAGLLCGLLVAVLYSLMTGWAIPAQRTVFMLSLWAMAKLSAVKINPWNIVGLALLITLSTNPWTAFDTGLLLSFGAVGILIFANYNWHRMTYKPWQTLTQASNSQVAITIGLIPITVALFNQQHWISPLANALSIPWMSFVSTPLAILGAFCRQDWIVQLAAWSLNIQQEWLNLLHQLPHSSLAIASPSWPVLIASCLGALILLLPKGLAPKTLGIGLLALLVWPAQTPQPGEFWVDVHDIGQGSAISIRTQNHHLLYDTGPAFTEQSNTGLRVLVPFYQQLGIHSIDQLWLSHNDRDHTGGAEYVLQTLHVAQVKAAFQPTELKLNERGIHNWSNCHTTQAWSWDNVHFEPLRIHLNGTEKDNNTSCLLKVSNASHTLLMTGDIEQKIEQQLVKHDAQQLKADILIVPHHGSNTSSSREFIQHVNPMISIIQAGWNNTYGHPHAQVLHRLEQVSTHIYNTANDCALQITSNPKDDKLVVTTARKQRFAYWHYQLRKTKAN